MEVNKPIPLSQPVEPDASPRSQRIPTDLVIFDLEPEGREKVESAGPVHSR
jgi:hypothetical protein